jgi:hypothetical protein
LQSKTCRGKTLWLLVPEYPRREKTVLRRLLKDVLLATETVFGSISSVGVSPDGRLYIADLANRRVRVVESNIPALNADQVPTPTLLNFFFFAARAKLERLLLEKFFLTQRLARGQTL